MENVPYPGLRYFTPEEKKYFFGREKQIKHLLDKMDRASRSDCRFLAVVGESGCGKSSLVRTGLIPKLGFIRHVSSRWMEITTTPGEQPFWNLAQKLYYLFEDNKFTPQIGAPLSRGWTPEQERDHKIAFIQATLLRGPDGLQNLLRQYRWPPSTNLLILIDQFEEIFGFCEDINVSSPFVRLLLNSIKSSDFPIFVIITMRSDFLGNCSIFEKLAETISDNQYLTPRLNYDEIKDAIEKPALRENGRVAPDLVSQLIRDMEYNRDQFFRSKEEKSLGEIVKQPQDQLPLLQHTLRRIWQEAAQEESSLITMLNLAKKEKKKVQLTMEEYRSVGSLEKALDVHGNQIYKKRLKNSKQKKIAEIMFRLLTETMKGGSTVRRHVKLKTVREVAGIGEDSDKDLINMVEAFRHPDCCFIRTDPSEINDNTTINITHESLIRQWLLLRDWAREEADFEETYRWLLKRALSYPKKKNLLKGGDLEQGQKLIKEENLNPAWAERYGGQLDKAQDFLNISQKQEEKEQKRSRLFKQAAFALAIFVPFLIVTVYGLMQRNEKIIWRAAEKTAATDKALAEVNAARAEVEKARAGAELAKFEAEKAKLVNKLTSELLHKSESSNWVIRAQHNISKDPTLALLQSLQALRISDNPQTRGNLIASLSKNFNKVLLPFSSKPISGPDGEDSIQALIFNPKGNTLIAGSQSGVLSLDVATNQSQILPLEKFQEPVSELAFSENKEILAVGFNNGDIILWNKQTGKFFSPSYPLHLSQVSGLAFGQNNEELVSVSSFGDINLWNFEKQIPTEVEGPYKGHKGKLTSLAFHPDGEILATASKDRSVLLWNLKKQERVKRLIGHNKPILLVKYSKDGSDLISIDEEGTAILWKDPQYAPIIQKGGIEKKIGKVAISPDGKKWAFEAFSSSVWSSSQIIICDFTSDCPLNKISIKYRGRISNLSFNADGKTLTASGSLLLENGRKNVVSWDSNTGQELQGPPISFNLDDRDNLEKHLYSPDEKTLVFVTSSFWEQTYKITLWDLEKNNQKGSRTINEDYIYDLAFHPDGKILAIVGKDNKIMFWDVPDLKDIPSRPIQKLSTRLAFTPDGNKLALGGPVSLVIRDLEQIDKADAELYSREATKPFKNIALTLDGQWLAMNREFSRSVIIKKINNPAPKNQFELVLEPGEQNKSTESSDAKQPSSVEPNQRDNKEENRIVLNYQSEPSSPKDKVPFLSKSNIDFEKETVSSLAFGLNNRWLGIGIEEGNVLLWDRTKPKGSYQEIRGHKGRVTAIAFHPNGKTVATGGEDNMVKIWDIGSAEQNSEIDSQKDQNRTRIEIVEPKAVFKGHEDSISSLAFSIEGDYLASGGSKNIFIWDVSARQPLGLPLTYHKGSTKQVSFDPEGETIYTVSNDQILKTPIGSRHFNTLNPFFLRNVKSAVHPEGKLLATLDRGGNIILWDTETGTKKSIFKGEKERVTSIAFSPDGKLLASLDRGGNIILWDTEIGTKNLTFKGSNGRITFITFSPNGKRLASLDRGRDITLWDTKTGNYKSIFKGKKERIASIAFSPDGKLMASLDRRGNIILWDAETGTEKSNFKGHDKGITSIAFSPDGKRLISAYSDKKIKIWDTTNGNLASSYNLDIIAEEITLSPNGKLLLISLKSEEIQLLTLEEDQLTLFHKIKNSENIPFNGRKSVAFSPDGKFLVLGRGRDIWFWDIANNKQNRSLKGHNSFVRHLEFLSNGTLVSRGSRETILWAPDYQTTLTTPLPRARNLGLSNQKQILAVAGENHSLYLLDAANGKTLAELEGHEDQILTVSFGPNDKILASGSLKGVFLWDLTTHKLIGKLSAHAITSLLFSPDGSILVCGGDDGSLHRWVKDPKTEEFKEEISVQAHSNSLTQLAFSIDGETLASGGKDNSIGLWDVDQMIRKGEPLKKHTQPITGLAFGSPESNLLFSSSGDGKIILWDIDKGESLTSLPDFHDDWVGGLAFDRKKNNLVSVGLDNKMVAWDVGIESWKSRACQIIKKELIDKKIKKFLKEKGINKDICPDLIAR